MTGHGPAPPRGRARQNQDGLRPERQQWRRRPPSRARNSAARLNRRRYSAARRNVLSLLNCPIHPHQKNQKTNKKQSQINQTPDDRPRRRTFNVASLNVTRAFHSKAAEVAERAAEDDIDVVAIQEPGTTLANDAELEDIGYFICKPSKLTGQVALLVSTGLRPFVTQQLASADGRACGIVLRLPQTGRVPSPVAHASVLVASVYMPTGLDRAGEEAKNTRSAAKLAVCLQRWTRRCQKAIILGDFNATYRPSDRELATAEEGAAALRPLPHGKVAAPPERAESHQQDGKSQSEPDRTGVLPTAPGSAVLKTLLASGLSDAYAEIEASAADECKNDGRLGHMTSYTKRPDGRWAASRLDLALLRNIRRDEIRSVRVSNPPIKSTHRLLVLELAGTGLAAADCTEADHMPRWRPKALRWRAASDESKQAAASAVETALAAPAAAECLQRLVTREQQDSAWRLVNTTAYEQLRATLGLTSGRPFQNRRSVCLNRVRHRLAGVRRTSEALKATNTYANRQRWMRAMRRGFSTLQAEGIAPDLRLAALLRTQLDPASEALDDLIKATSTKIRSIRGELMTERTKMKMARQDSLDVKDPATMRRLLHGDPEAAKVSSLLVQTREGQERLITSPLELADTLRVVFQTKFAQGPAARPRRPVSAELATELERLYEPRTDVNPTALRSLLAPISIDELRQWLSQQDGEAAAPGPDGVPGQCWRWLLLHSDAVAGVVCTLFTASISAGIFPGIGRHATILPLLKKKRAPPAPTNLRPIALQVALVKILALVQAKRLAALLTKLGILQPAQQGFLPGTSTHAASNVLLDAIEQANEAREALLLAFYDIKGAFDNVKREHLRQAMRRLQLPPTFINWVLDSMTGLTAVIRTPHGLSAPFDIEKGIRQGDPLSPVLFAVFMDPMLALLQAHATDAGVGVSIRGPQRPAREEKQPTGLRSSARRAHAQPAQAGQPEDEAKQAQIGLVMVARGFADDVAVGAPTVQGLRAQHERVVGWCTWIDFELNAKKSQILCINHSDDVKLTVEDSSIQGGAKEINYLGVPIRVDGAGESALKRATSLIGRYSGAAVANKLRPDQAISLFQTWLSPALEHVLPYARPSLDDAEKWDAMIGRCVATTSGLHRQPLASAVASFAGLTLPSQQHSAAVVSEAFIRLNSNTEDGQCARARYLTADIEKKTLAAVPDAAPPETAIWPRQPPKHAQQARLLYATQLATCLGISLSRTGPRPPMASGHAVSSTLANEPLELGQSAKSQTGRLRPLRMHVDGSSGVTSLCVSDDELGHPTISESHNRAAQRKNRELVLKARAERSKKSIGAFAVIAEDDILLNGFHTVPNEREMTAGDPDRFTSFSGIVLNCVSSHYAELAAILHAVLNCPTNRALTILSDSESARLAVATFADNSQRRQCRAQGRPLLRLITAAIEARRTAGSSTTIAHVQAHQDANTIESAANRLADRLAKDARERQIANRPPGHRVSHAQLEFGELWLSARTSDSGLLILRDIREEALLTSKTFARAAWRASASQGALARVSTAGCSQLWLEITGWRGMPRKAHAIRFLVAVLTNTVQYLRRPAADDRASLPDLRSLLLEGANTEHIPGLACVASIIEQAELRLPLDSPLELVAESLTQHTYSPVRIMATLAGAFDSLHFIAALRDRQRPTPPGQTDKREKDEADRALVARIRRTLFLRALELFDRQLAAAKNPPPRAADEASAVSAHVLHRNIIAGEARAS